MMLCNDTIFLLQKSVNYVRASIALGNVVLYVTGTTKYS
jgi:hypothetical protein